MRWTGLDWAGLGTAGLTGFSIPLLSTYLLGFVFLLYLLPGALAGVAFVEGVGRMGERKEGRIDR